MSMNLESAKHINQRAKGIVSGFIRSVQHNLPYQDNSFYIIPELIHIIILIFYYGEYFAVAGDYIDIDNSDVNVISFESENKDRFSTAYGNIDITATGKKKYIWDFKCTKIEPNFVGTGALFIGMDNSGKQALNESTTNSQRYYTFTSYYYDHNNGLGYACGKMMNNYDEDPGYSSPDEEFKENDEIRMELDTNDKTLLYFRNGSKIGSWCKNINFDQDTKY